MIDLNLIIQNFMWLETNIPNNSSLDINTIQGLQVNYLHEYSDYVGKSVHRLGGWEVGHELNEEP